MSTLEPATRDKLKTVSTATLTAALFRIADEAAEMTAFEDFVTEEVLHLSPVRLPRRDGPEPAREKIDQRAHAR